MMMDEKKKMMTKQVIIYAKMESSVVYVIAVRACLHKITK